MKDIIFKNSQECFLNALELGLMSLHPNADNSPGNYMYMGTWSGLDHFKSIDTRKYITCLTSNIEVN